MIDELMEIARDCGLPQDEWKQICALLLAIEQYGREQHGAGFEAGLIADRIEETAQPQPESQDEYPSVKQKRLLGEARAMLAARGAKTEPSLSKQMLNTGYTPRDRKIECDKCGKLVSPQMMPLHECE